MDILIMRFSSLGDVVLTTGVIRQLKEQDKNLNIDILTYKEFDGVYKYNPHVRNVYSVERGIKLLDYIRYLKKLPCYRYVFNLQLSLRSYLSYLLIKGEKKSYHKGSFERRMYVLLRVFRERLNKGIPTRYAETIFKTLGKKNPSPSELRPFFNLNAVKNSNKIVIHPFASKYTKIWPYFDLLSKDLVKLGYDVYIIGKGVFPESYGVTKVETSGVAELVEFLKDSACVITTDSGPMHIAVGLNIPVVAIFGSTTREFGFMPFYDGCEIVERNDVDCRPCHVHGLQFCPKKHFKCMDISVQEVLSKICNQVRR